MNDRASRLDGLAEWRAAAVGAVLSNGAAAHPLRPALMWSGASGLSSLTFRELDTLATVGAADLDARGHHSPVAVWAPNDVAWCVLFWAAARSGRPLVPLNPSLTAAEAARLVADSAASTVLACRAYRGHALRDEMVTACEDLPSVVEVLDLDDWYASMGETAAHANVHFAGHDIAPTDPLLIQYTSGTTGTPKGAVLSHQVCLNAARTIAWSINPGDHEIFCSPMPLHHIGGSLAFVLAPLTIGGTYVIVTDFTAEQFIEAASASKATLLGGVPTLYLRILENPELAAARLPSLRTLMLGGASIPPALVSQIEEHFGAHVLIMYGQSEAPAVSTTKFDDPARVKAETLGRPLPMREVRICDPATGAELGLGRVGEIQVRTRIRMDRYLNRPEETAATIDAEGWLRTGDLGSMDQDGLLHFHGRLKEIILRGGENVYAREVELAIESHPGVAEVAVVGLPDDVWGEIVAAVVVPTSADTNLAELEAHVVDRLAPFKRPVRWHFVDALPLTASGKPQKFKVVESLLSD